MRAVLFDLDGTLVDTESATDRAIGEVLAALGLPGIVLPVEETRGRTWADTVAYTLRTYPLRLSAAELEARYVERWLAITRVEGRPIPGVERSLAEAADALAVAVVSSSPRAVIAETLNRLSTGARVTKTVGAEDVHMGKPAPECFLRGAHALGVDPAQTVVFEDSRAGLLAARAAGMQSVVVLSKAAERGHVMSLADGAIEDYASLPWGFWADLRAGRIQVRDLRPR